MLPFIFIFEVRVVPFARLFGVFFSSSVIRLFSPNLPRLFTSLTEITRCHPPFLSVYLIEKNKKLQVKLLQKKGWGNKKTRTFPAMPYTVLVWLSIPIVTASSNRCPTLLLWWNSSKNIYSAELPRKLGFFYWFWYWNI